MTSTAHTPTPWEADGDCIVAPGAMCRYKTVATMNYSSALPITNAKEAKRVAAFIVRAVNAHDDLIQAGRDVIAALQMRFMRSGASASEEKAFKALRAAISKGEPKQQDQICPTE